jgi:hypothetical protein
MGFALQIITAGRRWQLFIRLDLKNHTATRIIIAVSQFPRNKEIKYVYALLE